MLLNLTLLAIFSLVILLFLVYVFRDPERILEYKNTNIIVSPCDGIIKNISSRDGHTLIEIKVNLLDSGVIRTPAFVDSIINDCKYGLFFRKDTTFQRLFNTKFIVHGSIGKDKIYTMHILPELWNKVSIYDRGVSFVGDRLGFMKCGNLVLDLHIPCGVSLKSGDVVYGGHSVLGHLV